MMQMPEEITKLAERVEALQPKNVMEIGSFQGGTFYLWSKLAKRDGLKISLDLPNGEFGANDYMDAEDVHKRAKLFNSFAHNVHVITGNSHDTVVKEYIRSLVGKELLDFLFIDGDHGRAGVAQDFKDYSPLVRPGGLIAIHDIRDSEYHRVNGCLVHEFWRELDRPKQEIIDRFAYWGGIGLVAA